MSVPLRRAGAATVGLVVGVAAAIVAAAPAYAFGYDRFQFYIATDNDGLDEF